MRPRRNVFGEGFILETVRCFKRAKCRSEYSEGELQWAQDVLDEYFHIVEDTEIIGQARREYESLSSEGEKCNFTTPHPFKPYPLSACPQSSISFDQLGTLFLRRRSVRWYQQKSVPDDLIQKAVNIAALAPSACNRQPYRFVVVNDPDAAPKIAQCAGGTTGFAHQIPAIIVVVGDLSAYPKERDRHLIYIDSSLASMQLMLAAETLGLASCPINWPDVDRSEVKLQKILKLPSHERVIMLIAIGYGDLEGGIAYSQKKQDAMISEGCLPK